MSAERVKPSVNRKNRWIAAALVLPGVLFIVFFMLVPLFSLCLTSFFPGERFSLSSYFSLFGDVYFQQVFIRSLRLSLLSTALCALLGASMEITGDYPAWEYKRDSALRDTMVRVFTEQYGHAPKIEAIHAGLECGLFSGKLPGLDCVSFGPDLLEIHTPREKMSIPSVQRTWKLLRGVLEALA